MASADLSIYSVTTHDLYPFSYKSSFLIFLNLFYSLFTVLCLAIIFAIKFFVLNISKGSAINTRVNSTLVISNTLIFTVYATKIISITTNSFSNGLNIYRFEFIIISFYIYFFFIHYFSFALLIISLISQYLAR